MGAKKYSDKYLDKLWRQAVLAANDYKCAYCGKDDISELECHHISKRRHKILRWDWRNGIPGCKFSCHMFYHSLRGSIWIAENHKYFQYLSGLEGQYTQYLVDQNLSDIEFRLLAVTELKRKIKEKKNDYS